MSFCPRCKYEYHPGIQICPDCGEMLFDSQSVAVRAAFPPDNSWVQICSITGGVKSDMAVGALKSSNIPATVISSAFGAFSQGVDISTGLSKIRNDLNFIMVPREFSEEAVLILEAVLGEDYLDFKDNQK